MEKNRFWELFAKVKSGEATPEEQLELNQQLAAFPGHPDLVKQIDAYWELPLPLASAPTEEETSTAWDKIRNKMSNQEPLPELPVGRGKVKRIIKYMTAIAAIFILAIGGRWWYNTLQIATLPQKNI